MNQIPFEKTLTLKLRRSGSQSSGPLALNRCDVVSSPHSPVALKKKQKQKKPEKVTAVKPTPIASPKIKKTSRPQRNVPFEYAV